MLHAAAALIVLLGLAHSVLGGRRLLVRQWPGPAGAPVVLKRPTP